MRCISISLFFLLGTVTFQRSDAMFAFYETQQVPIARVFTNLQQRLSKNTNDFELIYYLARLHSMAYSTNLEQIGVRKKDDAPQFDWPGFDSGVPRSIQTFPTA